jgi:hypothetical protein
MPGLCDVDLPGVAEWRRNKAEKPEGGCKSARDPGPKKWVPDRAHTPTGQETALKSSGHTGKKVSADDGNHKTCCYEDAQ